MEMGEVVITTTILLHCDAGKLQPPLLATHPAVRLNFEPAAQPVFLLDSFALSCAVLALA